MEEIWQEIKEYENLYMISSYGRVKSLNYKGTGREEIKKLTVNEDGYLIVSLFKNGKKKLFRVNRLVGFHFIAIPEYLKDIPIEKLDVGHLKKLPDGTEDKTANEVWNLAWMSRKENLNYGTHNKRMTKALTNRSDQSKLVLQIDKKTNEVIAEFPSTMEVQRQLGYSNSGISQCCLGKRKQSYGYKWQYG